MNQQREVIYSLRLFALMGGEELRGEAIKMIDKALDRRVRTALEAKEDSGDWDLDLLREDLLMHYLLRVPSLETDDRPTTVDGVASAAVEAAQSAFVAKEESLNAITDESGVGFAPRLLSLVMLNVLDEKWKDHLYDLDQLRGAIHYRSWGQKDPLIEYKQEAYTMFVDLMHDIHTTFTERFLRAQLVFNAPPSPQPASGPDGDMGQRRPQRRYNALGVLEDIPADEVVVESTNGAPDAADGDGAHRAPEPARAAAPVRQDPTIVGAGRAKKLSDFEGGKGTAMSGGGTGLPKGEIDWSSVGRNDPCPCGSGKKYKKCHGA